MRCDTMGRLATAQNGQSCPTVCAPFGLFGDLHGVAAAALVLSFPETTPLFPVWSMCSHFCWVSDSWFALLPDAFLFEKLLLPFLILLIVQSAVVFPFGRLIEEASVCWLDRSRLLFGCHCWRLQLWCILRQFLLIDLYVLNKLLQNNES